MSKLRNTKGDRCTGKSARPSTEGRRGKQQAHTVPCARPSRVVRKYSLHFYLDLWEGRASTLNLLLLGALGAFVLQLVDLRLELALAWG